MLYDAAHRQWAIYNEDRAPLPPNAAFNVLTVKPGGAAFVHRAASSSA